MVHECLFINNLLLVKKTKQNRITLIGHHLHIGCVGVCACM